MSRCKQCGRDAPTRQQLREWAQEGIDAVDSAKQVRPDDIGDELANRLVFASGQVQALLVFIRGGLDGRCTLCSSLDSRQPQEAL